MVHQYKVGDKVRIIKREGNPHDYPCCFADEMSKQEGRVFTIIEIKKFNCTKDKFYNGDNNYYLFAEDFWEFRWHSSMFEPVLEDPKSTFFTSFKEGDLLSICGIIGKIQSSRIHPGYFLLLDNIHHTSYCDKLKELIPDFEKIADKCNTIERKIVNFPIFSTIDDLVKFVQAVNHAYNFKKSITTTKTLNENEIKFQRTKASSKRGIVPAGRAICGRRRKIAIESGHLSNTTCYC